MYKIRKFTVTCPECGGKNNFENTELEGNTALLCLQCGEETLDLDQIREDVLQAILRLNPHDLQSWAGIEQDGESLDPDTLREIGNIQGWDVYLDPYGKPWLYRGDDEEEPGNAWMLPIFRYIGKGERPTTPRPREKNGRLTKMLGMDQLIDALQQDGGGPTAVAVLARILQVDPRTARTAYAQATNRPYATPIEGKKTGNVWIYWLEEDGEEEEEIEEPKGGFHNVYEDDMQMICNVCGHKFKKGDACYSVDRMKMVGKAEGDIKAVLQVCEKCIPEKLKKASWDPF